MPRGRNLPAKAWVMVCLSQSMAGLFYIDRQSLAVLKRSLDGIPGLGEHEYSLMVTAFMAAYASTYLFSGWIIDRWGIRRTFPIFIGLMSLATLGCGLATTLWELGGWRALLGAADAGV